MLGAWLYQIGFDCNTVISVKLQRDENPDIISVVDGEGRENKSERQKATVLSNKVESSIHHPPIHPLIHPSTHPAIHPSIHSSIHVLIHLPPPVPGNHEPTSCLCGFACSGRFPSMQSHTVCPSVSASLSEHHVFRVHPHRSLCRSFTPFHSTVWTTFCVSTHPRMDARIASIFRRF